MHKLNGHAKSVLEGAVVFDHARMRTRNEKGKQLTVVEVPSYLGPEE